MSGYSLRVFCGAKTSIETSMRWSVFLYLSKKRNQKFKCLVQTKPMGENTVTRIMKVSVAGTSLKESEKKVCESLCKKNNSQEVEESKTEVVFSRIPLKGQQFFAHSLNLLSVFLNGAFHLVDFTPPVMKLALEFFKAVVEGLKLARYFI